PVKQTINNSWFCNINRLEGTACTAAGYTLYRETLLIFLMTDAPCDWQLILHREESLLVTIGKSGEGIKWREPKICPL
ncbi:MAG: hypothetical protein KGN35_09740, partial [Betaproteobacteria bacterium]|nr:hypothetical protein [Betaproteobacteria bacterium]